METVESKQPLHDDHLQDLRKSGLSDASISRLGFKAIRPHDIKLPDVVTAYSIPYFDIEGRINGFWRQRLFPPRKTSDGHNQKYSQPAGSSTHLYLPALVNWLELVKDPAKSIVITEGEKKAAKACQEGLATFGVAGVWCWRSRIEGGEPITIPDLDHFIWANRVVEIVPDSDAWKPKKPLPILAGLFALAKELQKRGARVSLVKLPDLSQPKAGLDDWFSQEGRTSTDWVKLERIDLSDERLNSLTAWHQKWQRRQEKAEELSNHPLAKQVDEIRKNGDRSYEKNQQIANLALSYLNRTGTLIRTHVNDELLFFDQRDKLLQPLESQDFLARIYDRLRLNPIETESRFVKEEIRQVAWLRGERKTVHELSYWDIASKTLHISKNDGTMFLLDGTTITEVDNGQNGVLFKTDSKSPPIIADLSASSTYFHEVFEGLSLEGDATQIRQARALLEAWVLSIVFIEALPVRPILVLVGEQGSGKTSLARRIGLLLYGEGFQVTGFRRDQQGEGDFLAAITNQRFIVFDNADSNISWLPDHIARIATGAVLSRRKYFSTNDHVTYTQNCFLALTSRDTRWNRGDVTQRLLPVKFHAIASSNIPESALQQSLLNSREQIWGSMVHTWNSVVARLRAEQHQITSCHRLADFEQLGRVIAGAIGIEDNFIEAMSNLSQSQQTLLAEGNERCEIIVAWLRDPGNSHLGVPITGEELFRNLKDRYKGDERAFPFRSPTALATWVGMSKDLIRSQCEIVVAKMDTRTERRWIFKHTD